MQSFSKKLWKQSWSLGMISLYISFIYFCLFFVCVFLSFCLCLETTLKAYSQISYRGHSLKIVKVWISCIICSSPPKELSRNHFSVKYNEQFSHKLSSTRLILTLRSNANSHFENAWALPSGWTVGTTPPWFWWETSEVWASHHNVTCTKKEETWQKPQKRAST